MDERNIAAGLEHKIRTFTFTEFKKARWGQNVNIQILDF